MSVSLIFQQYKLKSDLRNMTWEIHCFTFLNIVFIENIRGHWEITWENELENLFSLIWWLWRGAFTTGKNNIHLLQCLVWAFKHPSRNRASFSVSSPPALVKHQYCTLMTSKYITARTTLHKYHVHSCFAQNKTPKNIQRFTTYQEVKVIQSVQMSPYGHDTTPNEGTILLTSTLSTPLTWWLDYAAGG